MKPRRFLSTIGGLSALVASLFSGCGKDNPVTPDNQAPVVDYFTESPASVAQGGMAHYAFKAHDPDGTLDSLVLVSPDGSRQKWTPHSAAYQDSATLVCNTPGPQTATFTAYDNDGAKASASADFTVSGNAPPVVNTTTLHGVEGAMSAVALKNIESDAENDPLTTQVTATSPGLEAHVDGDSLRYGMTNPDANGPASITLSVSDSHNPAVNAVVPVVIAAMDKIAGRVHDILEGSYISTVNPSLVLTGRVAGYVNVDGTETNVKSDGTFAFASKFKSQKHAIEWFVYSLSNPLDSSFVARDTIPAGDNTSMDLGVHTNAGTGPTPNDPPLSLDVLRAFYEQANLQSTGGPSSEGRLKSVNLKDKAKQRTAYLAAKDTVITSPTFAVQALTSEMQDTIEARLRNYIFTKLAPQNQPNIYKAKPNEPLPVEIVQGNNPVPLYGYALGFMHGPDIGSISVGQDETGENDRAVVTLNIQDPKNSLVAATIQEWLSWLCAPFGVDDARLNGKTCLYESNITATPFLTGADEKLLTFAVQYSPGTYLVKFLNVPGSALHKR